MWDVSVSVIGMPFCSDVATRGKGDMSIDTGLKMCSVTAPVEVRDSTGVILERWCGAGVINRSSIVGHAVVIDLSQGVEELSRSRDFRLPWGLEGT